MTLCWKSTFEKLPVCRGFWTSVGSCKWCRLFLTDGEWEVFPVEVDSKKVEERFDTIDAKLSRSDERLGRLEVSVAVLTSQCARLMSEVTELKSGVKDLSKR